MNHETDEHVNRLLFQQRLSPHRSMNARQFRLFMIIFACITTSVTVPFFLIGAWPIVGFLGLDVLLLYVAFRANFRAARAYEEINLDMLELRLEKVSARGLRREWRCNPRWVRLECHEDEDYGLMRLNLRFSGHAVEMGRFLAPVEREDFVRAFRPALHEAQRGPVFPLPAPR